MPVSSKPDGYLKVAVPEHGSVGLEVSVPPAQWLQ